MDMQWRWQHPRQHGNMLLAVAFGNGRFVAAGVCGTVAWSEDGERWDRRSSGSDWYLTCVAYGSGRFLAAEHMGDLLMSDDGEQWTRRPSPNRAALSALQYTGSQWIAVDTAGCWLTSLDGLSWQSRPLGLPGECRGIAAGNGMFALVMYDRWVKPDYENISTLYVSADGEHWEAAARALDYSHFHNVVFLNGRFLLPDEGLHLLSSQDGRTWTATGPGDWGELKGAAYGNGRYVAVGASGLVLVSDDGESWREAPGAERFPAHSVACDGDRFVVLGEGGAMLRWTPDGAWQRGGLPGVPLTKVFYAGGAVHCSGQPADCAGGPCGRGFRRRRGVDGEPGPRQCWTGNGVSLWRRHLRGGGARRGRLCRRASLDSPEDRSRLPFEQRGLRQRTVCDSGAVRPDSGLGGRGQVETPPACPGDSSLRSGLRRRVLCGCGR